MRQIKERAKKKNTNKKGKQGSESDNEMEKIKEKH